MRIMHGEEYGKLYQLSEFATHGCRILTIGREPDNLLPVTERQSTYVSRHHCTLETTPSGDHWIIRDGQWQKSKSMAGVQQRHLCQFCTSHPTRLQAKGWRYHIYWRRKNEI